MSGTRNKHVVVVVADLFFIAKIQDAAKRAGLSVRFAKNESEAVEAAAELPELMILDLNCATVDSLHVIRSLKARDGLRGIPLVGFLSHVQTERRQEALEAGCDTVLPRSAFAQQLTEILRKGG